MFSRETERLHWERMGYLITPYDIHILIALQINYWRKCIIKSNYHTLQQTIRRTFLKIYREITCVGISLIKLQASGL